MIAPAIALSRVVAGLLLLAGAGAGLIGLLPPSEREEADQPHVGWCFLAGAALAGLLLHVPLAIDGRIPQSAFLLFAGLSLVLAAGPGRALIRRVGVARFLGLDLLRELPAWLCVAVAALTVLSVLSALGPFVTWDERAIYGLKARILFHEGSVRGEAFTDPGYVHSQARYPLVVPLLEALLFTLKGSFDDRFLKLLFLAFGLGLALVVAGEVRRLHGPRAGGLSGFLLLSTPMLIGRWEGTGITGYADVPFAAFVTGATVLIGRSLERPDLARALLAGLLLGAALATKQEGALWAAALGIALLVVLWRRPNARAVGLARAAAGTALPALLFLAVGLAARRWIPPSTWSDGYESVFRLDWLRQVGSRPLAIASAVLGQLVSRQGWALGWLLVLAGLVCLRRPRLAAAPLLWRTTALTVFAAYLAVFVVTPNHVHWHLATALSRLLLHLFPLAVLVLAEQVGASGWPGRNVVEPAPGRAPPSPGEAGP